ncbi:hypothetical protein QTP22_25590, partial [Klebsiella grimontii]|uniref:hypothetical protein n=1 Tax=Klebsiella grimontii TaxID=2058152 RepID=UPI002A2687B3|nr:hypothetical protein [Klebsiella grimontii]
AQRHDHHVSNAAVERKASHQRAGLADIFVRGVIAVTEGFLLFFSLFYSAGSASASLAFL